MSFFSRFVTWLGPDHGYLIVTLEMYDTRATYNAFLAHKTVDDVPKYLMVGQRPSWLPRRVYDDTIHDRSSSLSSETMSQESATFSI